MCVTGTTPSGTARQGLPPGIFSVWYSTRALRGHGRGLKTKAAPSLTARRSTRRAIDSSASTRFVCAVSQAAPNWSRDSV